MKNVFIKILQPGAAMLLAWILVYGMAFADPGCCDTIVNICLPVYKKTPARQASDNSRTAAQPFNGSGQQESYNCDFNYQSDYSAGNTCCETDCCDFNQEASEPILVYNQNLHPLEKCQNCFDDANSGQAAIKSKNLTDALRTVSIYILTKSIIC